MCECHRCHKKFDWQYLLDKHLARKFPCKEQTKPIMEQNPHSGTLPPHSGTLPPHSGTLPPHSGTYNCEYCNKDCKRSDNKTRHELTCILKDDYVRNMEIKLGISFEQPHSYTKCRFCNKEFSKLSRHIPTCKAKIDYKDQLEKQLEEKHARVALQTINNTTNNNNTTNSHNTTNNITINLRPFGQENMEYLTRSVILKMCKKANFRNEIIPRLVKQVHCNPDHPENHNILLTNLRSSYTKVYDGEDYKVDTSKDVIDMVMDNVTDHLTTAAYTDNEDGKFNPYERAITRLEEDIGDEDSKFKREQRTKVKRNMYNNQKIIEKTRRTVEAQS